MSNELRKSAWLSLFRHQLDGNVLYVGPDRASGAAMVGHLAENSYSFSDDIRTVQEIQRAVDIENSNVNTILAQDDYIPFKTELKDNPKIARIKSGISIKNHFRCCYNLNIFQYSYSY